MDEALSTVCLQFSSCPLGTFVTSEHFGKQTLCHFWVMAGWRSFSLTRPRVPGRQRFRSFYSPKGSLSRPRGQQLSAVAQQLHFESSTLFAGSAVAPPLPKPFEVDIAASSATRDIDKTRILNSIAGCRARSTSRCIVQENGTRSWRADQLCGMGLSNSLTDPNVLPHDPKASRAGCRSTSVASQV